MKPPRYMVLSKPRAEKEGLMVTVGIKKWGWPIIIFKATKKLKCERWYLYIKLWGYVYPKSCIDKIRG